MGTEREAPSAARLSGMTTSLLTWIVEVGQQRRAGLGTNGATHEKIVANLLRLRAGLMQHGVQNTDPVLLGLRAQYSRICALVNNIDALHPLLHGHHLPLPDPPSSPPLPLIDVDNAPSPLSPSSSAPPDPSRPHPILDSSSDRLHSAIDFPARPRSRRALEEDEELMRTETEQVQRIQQVLLDDQDRTLDELSNAISRQRDLSLHISSELEEQETLLDSLDEEMDRTSGRLTRANRRMDSLFQKIAKDGACWTIFGLVAILLFLIVLLK